MRATVLVLEEDRQAADTLVGELQSAGYDVLGPASTAAAALSMIKNELPDLALLSARHQDEDEGLAVAAELGGNHGVPIVYMTPPAKVLPAEGGDQLSPPSGASAVLSKPLRRQELLATLHALLSDPVRKDMQHIFFHGEYLIACVDSEGIVRNANPAMEQALGYPRCEAVGMPMARLVHRSDLSLVAGFIRDASSHPGEKRRIEHRAVTKAGATRWLAWSVYADRKTGLVYAIGSDVTDQREQERRQRGFSHAFRNIGASVLVADSDYRITFVNETCTNELGYDPSGIVGRLLWDVMAELGAGPEEQKELKSNLARGGQWQGYLKTRRPDGTLLWRQIITSSVEDPEDNGAFYVGVSVDVTELVEAREELEAAREETRKQSERKSRFIAALAHDLRTPLNVVLGYADLLASEETDTEKLGNLTRIRDSARFQLDLLRDVGQLSLFEAGRMTFSRNAVSLRGLLEATTELFQSVAAERGIALRCETEARVPRYLLLDDAHLKQALMNLLSNAFKFTDSGSVEVRADWAEDVLEVSVADTGPGIPEGAKERIFQAFEHGAHDRSGSGLGLSIVREIVDALEGTIDVESTVGVGSVFRLRIPSEPADSPNADTESDGPPQVEQLVVTWRERLESSDLPPEILEEAIAVLIARAEEIRAARENGDTEALYRAAHDLKGMSANVFMDEVRRIAERVLALLNKPPTDAEGAFRAGRELEELGARLATRQRSSAGSADEQPGRSSRVLLAEDNRANRELFRAYLRRCGIEPETAVHGAEALEKLLAGDFVIGILDVEMPELSGIEVAKRLKEARPETTTRLVAVTGRFYLKSAPELQEFDSYLVKPVGERDLRLVVEPYCTSRYTSGGEIAEKI